MKPNQGITRSRAAALLAGGTTLAATRGRVRAQAIAPIRVAMLPSDTQAQIYYAHDMGFFTRAGLDAEIQQMTSTPAIGAALAGGAVDVGGIAVDTLANMHQRSVPIVAIASGAEYRYPTTANVAVLIVAANSPVRTAKDLDGATVATNALHSLAETAPSLWMDKNGGDSSSVKFVEIPFPAMAAACASGRIAAGFTIEPFITLGLEQKTVRILADCFRPIAPRFAVDAWCCAPDWASSHTDLVRRFASAMHEAAIWANTHKEQTVAILTKYVKLDPTVVAAMVRPYYSDALTPELLQPLVDVSAKYNHFPGFPAQELIAKLSGA